MKNQLEIKNLDKAILLLKSIKHPLRKDILKLIDSKKEFTVTEIYKKLQLEQSVVSQHLAILRTNKIVTKSKEGRFIRYKVNHDKIAEIKNIVEKLVN